MRKIEEIRRNGRLQIIEEGMDGMMGYIHLPISKRPLTFVFSWGGGWEHVSVSHRNKVPTWDEMYMVKDIFFEDEEVVVQYHPRKSEYVNIHPYTLHLWRPINKEIPTPPIEFV
ncbi:DUF7694 domain-containing protein [Tepidimicrobium xylanilyticum]|uniref:DUF7694 domain-containing protein n=1 Tax=Tepidimicrobium xylanilyticum TaxID=1123352 RepID=A0A1H3FD27_9FIRM|nr:hypothetical protein [Tepidimicrobium xylanilyticum]SDX88029.1 hypothetical protein SAMN05660923_03102 [Tepidimicrobium xylanilyticum]